MRQKTSLYHRDFLCFNSSNATTEHRWSWAKSGAVTGRLPETAHRLRYSFVENNYLMWYDNNNESLDYMFSWFSFHIVWKLKAQNKALFSMHLSITLKKDKKLICTVQKIVFRKVGILTSSNVTTGYDCMQLFSTLFEVRFMTFLEKKIRYSVFS